MSPRDATYAACERSDAVVNDIAAPSVDVAVPWVQAVGNEQQSTKLPASPIPYFPPSSVTTVSISTTVTLVSPSILPTTRSSSHSSSYTISLVYHSFLRPALPGMNGVHHGGDSSDTVVNKHRRGEKASTNYGHRSRAAFHAHPRRVTVRDTS